MPQGLPSRAPLPALCLPWTDRCHRSGRDSSLQCQVHHHSSRVESLVEGNMINIWEFDDDQNTSKCFSHFRTMTY